MASGAVGSPVGLSRHIDPVEAPDLKPGVEQLPLACSLQRVVLARYARPAGNRAQGMEPGELFAYLRDIDDFSRSPLDSVLALAAAMDDPSRPDEEQAAQMAWVQGALEIWRRDYPLEPELDQLLRPLGPLLAAMSLADPEFSRPGAHPLHQLLDTIQACGVGWQASLGRTGESYLSQVERGVAQLRDWFLRGNGDLAGLCEKLSQGLKRERERGLRMARRMADTEQGRLKSVHAQRKAAGLINAALAQGPLPSCFNAFLCGPWYDSARLVLLRSGENSEPWRQMCVTTEALLDSLRMEGPDGTSRRKQVFETIARLPGELKRSLFSLQHDPAAIEEAVGAVETVHLAILKQQELPREAARPLPMEPDPDDDLEMHGGAAPDQHGDGLARLQAEQWFAIDHQGLQRLMLALKLDDVRRLVFCNHAGQRALELGFDAFSALLRSGRAYRLAGEGGFSLSLIAAAGIHSRAELAAVEMGKTSDREQKSWIRRQQRLRDFERAEWLQHGPDDLARTSLSQSEQEQIASYLSQRQKRLDRDAAAAEAETATEPVPERSGRAPVRLQLGSWLGFNDSGQAVTAKLAAHDRERGVYIFVDRAGNPLRELSKKDLQDLLDRGQIDLLQQHRQAGAEQPDKEG